MNITWIKIVFLLIMGLNAVCGLNAQGLKPTDPLFREIAHHDSLLFNAFNTRDIATFGNLFSKDLEFFHDKGGLTNLAYTIESLNKTTAANNGLRRDLVPGSMEIYPIPGYGAIQVAAHTFCHQEAGKQDCGTFKFVHIWNKTPGGWKLARVVSYGH